MKVDNPIKTSNGWIHQTSARMVWPNAGLVIAVSAFGIRKGFRCVARSTRNELKVNFRLYKNLLSGHFCGRLLVAVMFAIDAVISWNHADAMLTTGRLQGLVKFEPAAS